MKNCEMMETKIKEYYGDKAGQVLFSRPVGQKSLAIVISFRDGVTFEEHNEWGVSHFLEHLHFQGTPRYPSLTAISTVIEEEGGKISAFSMRDSTSYFVKIPCLGLKTAFHMLTEILTNCDFSLHSIETEKSIIQHEMDREKANYSFYHNVNFEGIVLSPLPICRYPTGNQESVSTISADKVLNYKMKAYVRENCYITVVGAANEQIVKEEIGKFLHSLPEGKKRKPFEATIPFKGTNPAILEYPGLSNVNIVAGWGIRASMSSDWIPWNLLNTLLGVGFGSLLYRVIREKHHLTYLTSTAVRIYSSGGVFKVTLDVKPEDVEKALKLIRELIRKLQEKEIDEHELRRAKSRMWGNIIFKLEDTLEYARFLNRLALNEGECMTLSQIKKEIDKVSVHKLAELVEHHLSDEMFMISLAGSKEALEKVTKV